MSAVSIRKISSAQNPLLKKILRLYGSGSFRKKERAFVVEGLAEIRRALASPHPLVSLLAPEAAMGARSEVDTLRKGLKPSATHYEIPQALFDKITYRGGRNNALAVFDMTGTRSISSLKIGENSSVLIADAIEKPGNLGALFRTAAALEFHAILIAAPITGALHPNTIRNSLGTVFTLPYAEGSREEIFALMQKHRLHIHVSALQADAISPAHAALHRGGLVVGAEHCGVDDFWLQRADQIIQIPMAATGPDSLNVSTAAAILMYEAQRQRTKRQGQR